MEEEEELRRVGDWWEARTMLLLELMREPEYACRNETGEHAREKADPSLGRGWWCAEIRSRTEALI
jgi:hypothetical protein